MSDDKIVPLGIKHVDKRKEDKMLTLVPHYEGCLNHCYVVDAEAEKVTCKKCDKVFNPMSVLVDLTRKESRWMMNFKRYQEEMKRLDKRQRTKCNHCGEMTKISRR